MLVLSRKQDETVVINGDILVTVVAVQGNRVRLGILAPKEVVICRKELQDVNVDQRTRGKQVPANNSISSVS